MRVRLSLFAATALLVACAEGNRPEPLFDYAPERVTNYIAQYTPEGDGTWSWILALEQDYEYDDQGRLTSEHLRDYAPYDYLELRTFSWSNAGRLDELIEAPGDSVIDPEYIPTVRHRYQYDDSGRPERVSEERSEDGSWELDSYLDLSYRDDGRLGGYDACTTDDCTSTSTFFYDGAGAVVAEETHVLTGDNKFRDEITYDSEGRIARTTHYYAEAEAWVQNLHYEHEYDNQGRLARKVQFLEIDEPILIYTWSYDDAGRVSEVLKATCEITDDDCVPFEKWQISFTDAGTSRALESERPTSMIYSWSWLYYGRPEVNRNAR